MSIPLPSTERRILQRIKSEAHKPTGRRFPARRMSEDGACGFKLRIDLNHCMEQGNNS
jgi:hypothetical protein